MKFGIFQKRQRVGTVTGTDAAYEIDTDDPALVLAVNKVMKAPAGRMLGRIVGDVIYDSARTYQVGDPNHMEAAITSGALLQFGYIGKREA